MTQEQIYKEKICKYCKGNCNKGIMVFTEQSTVYTKCVDYEKKEISRRVGETWQKGKRQIMKQYIR